MLTAKVPILEYCTLLLDSPSPPGVALLGKQLQVSLLSRILVHEKTELLIFFFARPLEKMCTEASRRSFQIYF